MKKIAGLVIGISVVIALVMTGTFAFFSDTETTGDNTFTAGIIDLVMDPSEDDPGQAVASTDGTQLEFKPCETGYLTITLTPHADSNPMHVWKHIKLIEEDDRGEGDIPDAEQEWYDDPNNPSEKNDIDRYIHFDMTVNTDLVVITEDEGWLLTHNPDANTDFDPDPIDGSTANPAFDFNGVTCKWIYLGILDPAGDIEGEGPSSMTIVESFHMDAVVDNWAQGDVLTFVEEFYGVQVVSNDTPNPPGDELPGYGYDDAGS